VLPVSIGRIVSNHRQTVETQPANVIAAIAPEISPRRRTLPTFRIWIVAGDFHTRLQSDCSQKLGFKAEIERQLMKRPGKRTSFGCLKIKAPVLPIPECAGMPDSNL
jgi:hypothetical protein